MTNDASSTDPQDAADSAADGAPIVRGPRPPRPFTLDRFLKYEGVAETGGHAKLAIQDGQVMVNGEVETRRRRQLTPGDVIEIAGEQLVVPGSPPAAEASGDRAGGPEAPVAPAD
ncbi:MAG: RNA-binding S4 domain-containing protein [Phycisphaerales bacterium]